METASRTPVVPTRVSPSLAAPRRVLATRRRGWAGQLAQALARTGIQPNTVSITGIVFATGAALAFSVAPQLTMGPRAAILLVAAATIQLRLLCNLLDGMLAIEHERRTKTGEIFNEMPDRIADVLILVGAGYAVRTFDYGTTLGWTAAVMALFTAYVRLLAGSLGVTQHFIGPMAKQHRMFLLTLATLVSALEAWLNQPPRALYIGLVVIVAGSIVTAVRRTRRMVHEVNAR